MVWARESPTSTMSIPASSTRRPLGRSEEHTSELQSPCNLVCRLLLEKKNSDGCGLTSGARHGHPRLAHLGHAGEPRALAVLDSVADLGYTSFRSGPHLSCPRLAARDR